MGPAPRNIAIVLVLAAAVAFVPGGGKTAAFVGAFLSTAVLTCLVLIFVRLYREHRVTIFGLGDRHRAMFYGALGAIVLALAGRGVLLDSGLGVFAFFVLLGGAMYALVLVFQHWRSYSI